MATSTRHSTADDAGLIDLLPFPAALIDMEGRFLYRNEARRQHPLWRGDVASEQPSGDPGDRQVQLHRGICAKVVQSGKAHLHVETVRDADGTARRYRWLCLPLHSGRGTVEHLLLVALDDEATPGGLSDRELEVFEHLGHGRTTQQIAEAMLISPKTVESYRARIKEKLGLEHNTELIRHAVRWIEGGAPVGKPAGKRRVFLNELVEEIRSPLAAIAGLAGSLAQRATPEQARLADLILTSTEQLIRCLDLKVRSAQRREDLLNGRRAGGDG